jgi:hypothetical protein
MPTRKPTAKKTSTAAKGKAVQAGRIVLYGVAIRNAIARGDAQEMRQLAALARKQVSDVSAALGALEKKIQSLG